MGLVAHEGSERGPLLGGREGNIPAGQCTAFNLVVEGLPIYSWRLLTGSGPVLSAAIATHMAIVPAMVVA